MLPAVPVWDAYRQWQKCAKNNIKGTCVITVHGSDDSVAFSVVDDLVLLFHCKHDNFRTAALSLRNISVSMHLQITFRKFLNFKVIIRRWRSQDQIFRSFIIPSYCKKLIVNTITHKSLHIARLNFARTSTLKIFEKLLNLKVIEPT